MIAIESIISRLGSRFALNFQPNRAAARVSALGRFLDHVAEIGIGIKTTTGARRWLPLCSLGPHFEYTEQELTMNSITFRARSAQIGCLLEATFTAPFYPKDTKLCTAPFFYVDVRIEALKGMVHWEPVLEESVAKGDLFFEVHRGAVHKEVDPCGITWRYRVALQPYREIVSPYAPPTDNHKRTADCTERLELVGGEGMPTPDGLVCSFDATNSAAEFHFVWAAHVPDPVLEANGEPTVFRYNADFADVNSVIAYARNNEVTIRRRSELFDALFAQSSLGKHQQNFIAYTFQTYLSNTWWTRRPNGEDWFSVWEGICFYNSTIDVEYNLGLVYFALWPELLELTFDEWVQHEQPEGFLSHDMGEGCVANGQSYPHHMEVEENTNFLLMVHAHWRWTGSDGVIRRHLPLIKRLIRYLELSDLTGNGFPNIGTANTIDDASAAVQYAKEQTYLGVKCLCAFQVAAQVADYLGETELAQRCLSRAEVIRKTLDDKAWLGDHYVVCLDKDAAGVKDCWTGEELPPGELEGWDAYSLYTSNGMLYPLIVGAAVALDADRIRADIVNATRHSLLEYGCTHSSADRSNIWVSQNLWRDFVAAYLGLDYLDMTARYWDFQVFENSRAEGRCFIDTYIRNNLCYYPRGITSIGMLVAALGMQLDRVKNELRLAPVRVPCRLPLTALADWENERIPWVEAVIEDGYVVVRVDGELPEGLRVITTTQARV